MVLHSRGKVRVLKLRLKDSDTILGEGECQKIPETAINIGKICINN